MTPKTASNMAPGQIVINTKTQEIGTVRTVDRAAWIVWIDWTKSGPMRYWFGDCGSIKRY